MLATRGMGRRALGRRALGRRDFASCAICAAVGLVAVTDKAEAQAQPGFTRRILQTTEFPGRRFASVLVEIEIEPNALVARHTHPGIESGYLVSGGLTLSVQGQPDRVLKPGDGYQVPPEMPHSVRNGSQKSRIAATFVVEKDQPLSSPAPE
jgi:quercetin dioxygenase-like cupin family protein